VSESEKPKTFPIMHGDYLRSIPLSLIAPHEQQADRNHSQTLRRLAERGGLSPCEAVAVIRDRPWKADPYAEAELCVLVGRAVASQLRDAAAPTPESPR
jgi:hypothetical protein